MPISNAGQTQTPWAGERVSAQIRWNKDAELTLPMRLRSRRVAESTAFDMLKIAPGDGRAAERLKDVAADASASRLSSRWRRTCWMCSSMEVLPALCLVRRSACAVLVSEALHIPAVQSCGGIMTR